MLRETRCWRQKKPADRVCEDERDQEEDGPAEFLRRCGHARKGVAGTWTSTS